MPKVLVLGAGRMAGPCVEYLLKDPQTMVTVVDQDPEGPSRILRNHPRGTGLCADAADAGRIITEVRPDMVVNLLPPPFMVPVAQSCVEARVHMVNPCYIKDDMRALDGRAREAGVTLLCELGLDPGIDHMSAVRTIRGIRQRGGRVVSFHSICGALPSAEANTNPWGYKLSWDPVTLMSISKRSARFLMEGREVSWPDGDTYAHVHLEEIDGMGTYEIYANADSLPYINFYGIPEARTVYRGTIRYPGWCETICKMNALGLFEENRRSLEGLTFRAFMGVLAGAKAGEDPEKALCRKLRLEPYSMVMVRFGWLGLLWDEPIPFAEGSPRDVVIHLFKKRLVYAEGERDMVILRDEIVADYPDKGKRVRHVSCMVDYGIPGGYSSVARTTGIPPAIGARLILEGKVRERGVHAPVLPEIYIPSLRALEEEGIVLVEKEEDIPAKA